MTHNTPFFHTPPQKTFTFFKKQKMTGNDCHFGQAKRVEKSKTGHSGVGVTCFVKLVIIREVCRSAIPLEGISASLHQ